jgi:hypothetical protein
LTGREKRLRDIQNALNSRSTPAVAQAKRPGETDASYGAPPAKKKRQLPPGYRDNDDYVPPKYERDDDSAVPRSALFSNGSRPVLAKSKYTAPPPSKKVSAVFLSQEQTQILKLVQDGNSVFYTGSAGQYWRIHPHALTTLMLFTFRNGKICAPTRNHQDAEEKA